MRKRLLLFIIPLAILAVALSTGFVLVWNLFVLSSLVLLISYLWTFLSIGGIGSHIDLLPKRCQVGESFNQEIIIFNKGRMPRLLLEAQENTDMPGYHNMAAFNLPSEGSHRWETKVNCHKRGEYSLGSLTVTANDPFGLFPRQLKMGEPQRIVVCPATLELPLFEPLSYQGTGYGPERWLASFFGPNVASVREYTAGDSLKRIHWLSTAHTNKLMVKIFDPDRTRKVARSVWVMLDMYQPAHLTVGKDSTEEQAVTIAASLIKKYVDEGLPIGLVASGDKSYLFQPAIGEQHLWHMLTALALAKAAGNTPIDQLISRESGSFSNESILIVITPYANERLVASLRQLRGRGMVVVAILLDPASFGGASTAVSAARALTSSAVQVHMVRRGDDLPVVLDSRAASHINLVRDGSSN